MATGKCAPLKLPTKSLRTQVCTSQICLFRNIFKGTLYTLYAISGYHAASETYYSLAGCNAV